MKCPYVIRWDSWVCVELEALYEIISHKVGEEALTGIQPLAENSTGGVRA